ncbi:MAG: LytTR family transcriptional regulator DNA-binding domain-containing protein [Actinobacteria bacterium]|nr:LytTR family transcriptional regulator DNA-binding domain-containing protein [Actinomycetota bacterium]
MEDYRYTIMLVEDEPLISEMVSKSLRLEGYEVEVAGTGEEGLQKIQETFPDLVLLDVLLPKLDGWDVLARLRENPRTREVPVIMLTALSDEKSKVQGLRGGADDYVTKPFSALELVARVEAVLKRYERPPSKGFKPQQLPARKGEKIYLINIDDIVFINIERDYTYLHTDSERYLTNQTLSELENSLDPNKFFRAHRGYIVNLQKVKEITKIGTSSYELTLDSPDNIKIPMSRRQSTELKKLLNM